MNLTAAVLTVSDGVACGLRLDTSGPQVAAFLQQHGFSVPHSAVVPDERSAIEHTLRDLAAHYPLVVTVGGTGIAARDVTPEATRAVCQSIVEGVGERMRAEGIKHTPLAALSRGVCGICGKALILNLPGSPAGALQSLQAVIDLLPHALELLAGHTEHNQRHSGV